MFLCMSVLIFNCNRHLLFIMEACGSRLVVNIYHRVFKKIYFRPTRHLCSKKEDKSGLSDASSKEADLKASQQLSDDSVYPYSKDGKRSAVEGEAVKFSSVTKGASEGKEDEISQAKLLSVLSDIKVIKTHSHRQSTINLDLAKPLQRFRKKKDPSIEKEQEAEKQLRVEYGNDMPSAVKAVASSLGGDVKQTEEKLVETLTSIANGLPIEEPVQRSPESSDEKIEPSTTMDEMSKNMMSSVEAVVSSVVGEPKEAESELTKKLLSLATEKSVMEPADMSEVVVGMKVDRTKQTASIRQPRMMHRKSTIHDVNLFDSAPLNVFKLENKDTSQEESPQLLLWDELQKKELQLLVRYGPSNPYEEMIQWTEQGKLWTFPINNEAVMPEEENVSFHEHIFLDHLLQEGFPKKGPIRHFMDLVIIGLSKNPYISVERKAEHVNWYREYFKKNRQILEQYEIAD